MINDWIEDNYHLIESIAKNVLRSRFKEGISSYYIHLEKKGVIPNNPAVHIYYYMKNLEKGNSEINYIPVTFKGDDVEKTDFECSEWNKIEMMIDLEDEMLVDFLANNTNNEKWIKIYEVMYNKGIELDMFETILFDYVFNRGWSIRKISEVTGNGPSYTYQLRRKLIEKLKFAIKNNKDKSE